MSRFDSYFLMQPEDVIHYVQEKLTFFDASADLACTEIGDGNINYVFRVWDKQSTKSIIVKQAGNTARISSDFLLDRDRIRIEAEVLQLEGRLAPELVPVVYKYDQMMNCCVMEDLTGHLIMRQALLNRQQLPLFTEHITTFMVNTLLLTSDVVLEHKQKKELVKRYINPDLCEITEDLVYTEPYNDYKQRNAVFPPNLEWVSKKIYGDQALRLEVAKLKFDFMSKAQSLLHGDLHTGSIFVKPDSTKVIDCEFAFYGPIGYDVGNIVANLIFAWANAEATMGNETEQADYCAWLEQALVEVVDLFSEKFMRVWSERATEIMAQEEGFARWYLESIIYDTAAVTGLELIRRIVGLAQVKDITSISNEQARIRAERICLTAAKRYIMERERYQRGTDFLATLKEAVGQFPN